MAVNVFPQVDEWLPFVILRHSGQEGNEDHYDLAMDILGELGSKDDEELALSKIDTLSEIDGESINLGEAMQIRRRYLDYEGQMRDNRGVVQRVDSGLYRLTSDGKVEFNGSRIKGIYHFDEINDDLIMVKDQ